ncbi:ferritin-like domain-containing protein [Flavobacterium circumlabens]|uniref:Ferritin-like domain-containing protein n=1 Tax=Flavobacterium circumlabens TaxID=2133765 RepID=A0A4Y7UFN7_9FLAO|nr:ferritin-like domain-containing protein [Flavobacterium circumlabens]TCN60046.1 ferritin-like metal-binding protein YciE [Flavobacterium circumlabens]TEB45280.1 ferritin-like domain-containing protein [Flavobacterium circumlabens]
MKNSEKQGQVNATQGKATDTENIKNNAKINIVEPAPDAATDLKELFVDSLKDIYWAENALVGALPKMAANATSPGLASAILEHLDVTKLQISRLEEVFDLVGEKAEGKKCEAMAGLLKEGDSIVLETTPGPVRDAGIIAASQKIEHYEIATYGTLVAFAKTLGENDAAKLLTQTLAEEKEADCVLNVVALNTVNAVAAE